MLSGGAAAVLGADQQDATTGRWPRGPGGEVPARRRRRRIWCAWRRWRAWRARSRCKRSRHWHQCGHRL